MSRPLDLDLLRAFVAIAETGSFTRAGQDLGRTQSAVSMQIKRLEDQLESRLLDRSRRNVAVTGEGRLLLGYAKRLLQLNDEAVAQLLRPEVDGAVKLGTPDDYATCFLPGILASFAQAAPRVRIDVACDESLDLIGEVEAGRLDLALLTRTPAMRDGEALRRERLVWCASPGSPALRAEPLPLALFPEGCLFRQLVAQAFDAEGRDWRVAYSSPSLTALAAAVSAGLAVTVLAESTVPSGLQILEAGSGLPQLPSVEIALFRRPDTLSTAARLLAQHIRETFGRAQPALAAA
ncbi:LysR substrate-binding domain-containing protein [Algihabitans albus]|uniref:LysR substrate-binding domain-containing protein n=1 Tax=Algihabitans albus TaxID=2164067 RepID=UPI000E5D43D0|nr:LysR substrate-binding domain-containing protein [Algihabitans albus]